MPGMARSTTASRPSTKTATSSSESLSEKLRDSDPRKTTRKRLSLTSETSASTATSNGGIPLNIVAAPVSSHLSEKHEILSPRSNNNYDDTEDKTKNRRRRSSAGRGIVQTEKVDHSSSKAKAQNNDLEEPPCEEDNHSPPPSVRQKSKGTPVENRPIREPRTRSSSNKPVRRREEAEGKSMPSRRRSSSIGKPRRTSTSSNRPDASPTPPISPRKRVSIANERRMSPKGRRISAASKPKIRRNLSGSETQSLKSFMQKQDSKRPEESEDALETKSAFTSVSRSRNRKKHIRSSPSTEMNGTYHGANDKSNTRTFREMVAAKAARNSRTLSKSHSQLQMEEDFDVSPAALSNENLEDSRSAFDRSFSENLNSSVSGSQIFQQSFSNLPVLEEEAKRPTKKTKSKKQKSKPSKKKPVSQQELSSFLDRCNEQRRKQEGKSSPTSGDRSCVSMPALQSTSKDKHRRASRLPQKPRGSLSKLQESIHSSDDNPNGQSTSHGKESNHLVEGLAEKGRRARSLSKSKTRQKRLSSQNKDQTDSKEKSPAPRRNRRSPSVEVQARDGPEEVPEGQPVPTKRHRRCQSVEARITRKEREDRTRSLSRSRRDSQTNGNSSSKIPTKGATDKPSDRSKRVGGGMKKLFSIRDLRSEAILSSPTASLEFRRVDTSSNWALTAANCSPPIITGDEASYVLTADSLIDNESGFEEKNVLASRLKGRSSVESNDAAVDTAISIVKNSMQQGSIQTSGVDEEQSQTKAGLCVDSDSSHDGASTTSSEDVFSLYTWTRNFGNSVHESKEARQERLRLKESIRESLLYTAFEAIYS